MSIQLKMFWAPLGTSDTYFRCCTVSGDGDLSRYQRYVCETLSALAQDTDDCDGYLGYLTAVEKGEMPAAEAGANDVSLDITPGRVQVNIDVFDEFVGQPEGVFTIKQWIDIFTGWRTLFALPRDTDKVFFVEM